MTPQIPGTSVFSLGYNIGLSFPHNSGLEPLELGGFQSCFAVSGSVAEARNLHQRWKAGARAVYGSERPILVHSGLSDFVHNTGATGVYAAGGSLLGHVTADDGDRAVLDHGWGALDARQSGYPDTMNDSRTSVFPPPHTNQSIPPVAPSTIKIEDSSSRYTTPVKGPHVERLFTSLCPKVERMADQDKEEFYIKGYKVDREKLLNYFTPRPEDPENVTYMGLWRTFPTEFLYLAIGKEPEGRTSLVVVLADGCYREMLEQASMVDLSEPYTKIFTPGIWVKYD